MSSKQGLPDGWVLTQVKDIVKAIDYGHTASARDSDDGPRFLRITDIQNGHVNWNTVPSCDLTLEELERFRLAVGDLVFARTGATTGKSFLIRDCPVDAIFASYLIRLRVSEALDPGFIACYFQTADYWQQISETSTGTAQPGVNATKLNELRLPVAPKREHGVLSKRSSRTRPGSMTQSRHWNEWNATSSATGRRCSKRPSRAGSSPPRQRWPSKKAATTSLLQFCSNASSLNAVVAGLNLVGRVSIRSRRPPTLEICRIFPQVGVGRRWTR